MIMHFSINQKVYLTRCYVEATLFTTRWWVDESMIHMWKNIAKKMDTTHEMPYDAPCNIYLST